MIAKAKAISHGINAIRYMSGESEHKKHPEKIYHVCNQNLDADMDALGIWMMMNLISASRMDVKNNVIRIEISPSAEHTKDFSLSDWKKLWNDFIEEFDKQVIYDKRVSWYQTKLILDVVWLLFGSIKILRAVYLIFMQQLVE